jgi:predicted nicotinamide N-methyase
MDHPTSPNPAADAAGPGRPTPAAIEAFIRQECAVGTPPLAPEIALLLARDAREIFSRADDLVGGGLGARPYWAFAWPGGQALARYILDNPGLVAGKRVLDMGSGSAIGAIATLKAGAASATAADIDPLAAAVAPMNAALSQVSLDSVSRDLLGEDADADLVLIGDLVYEPELQMRVGSFLSAAIQRGIPVLYADRTTARRPSALPFRLLAEYEAPLEPPLVEGFVERARVWSLGPSEV